MGKLCLLIDISYILSLNIDRDFERTVCRTTCYAKRTKHMVWVAVLSRVLCILVYCSKCMVLSKTFSSRKRDQTKFT